MESPFTIEVYDGAFNMKGTLGNPESLRVFPRHNQRPTAEIVVPTDHRRLADLTAPGARVIIRYRVRPQDSPVFLMSGIVRLRSGQGPRTVGTVTLQVVDDFRLFERMLGWGAPSKALDLQGTDAAFDTRTGPAESVLKGYVSANKPHFWQPITVATSQARGANITAKLRFQPLADVLLPMVDKAGIGVTVRQSGAGFLVDCYEPRLYAQTLTEASGVVQEWSWTQADPEATRIIAGGPEVGTNRTFRQYIDDVLENQYRDIIEVFVDGADAADATALAAKAKTAAADYVPKSGLSLKLSETDSFRYDPTGAHGVRVGDHVRVEVGPGVVVEDVLREASLEWTTDNGLVVTPVIGEKQDDPSRSLLEKIRRLDRGFRNLTAGR